MRMNIRKLTELALLTAVALGIYIIELRLPNLIPIPGVKLGLANIITVCAVYHYRGRDVLLLVLTRIFLGSMFSGNMVSILYSLCGGILCMAGMLLMKRAISEKHIWVCSILSAVLHNIGQMGAAVCITKTPSLLLYFPVLMISGCVTGLFTGVCAQVVFARVRRVWGPPESSVSRMG